MRFINGEAVVLNDQLKHLKGDICLDRQEVFSDTEDEESFLAAGTGYSAEYIINERVAIQFMCLDVPASTKTTNKVGDYTLQTTVLVSFRKLNVADSTSYKLDINSRALKIEDKIIATADNGTWHMIREAEGLLEKFDVYAVVNEIVPVKIRNTFSAIHDDTELTDFEMKGVDGEVRVHRAVLAAASPVLRRMLSGEWREAGAGRVEVPHTTRATLQHFKDYIYLGVLPATGLRPLLLLASCYMIPELESRCVDALVDGLKADTTYETLEFAFSNKQAMLVMKILERVKAGKVKGAAINAVSE